MVSLCIFLACTSLCPLHPQFPPGVTAQVELPGTNRGLQGGRARVPERPGGLPSQLPQHQQCRERALPSLLREFPGISAPVCPLLKENSGQTPVPLPGLACGGEKILSHPVPGGGGDAWASLSSLRIIIFQQNFLSHLSMFLQLKPFLLPNFQHLEFGFSLLKKKKIQNPQSG